MCDNGRFRDLLVKYHIISAEMETPVSRVAPLMEVLCKPTSKSGRPNELGPSLVRQPHQHPARPTVFPTCCCRSAEKSGCEMGLAARGPFHFSERSGRKEGCEPPPVLQLSAQPANRSRKKKGNATLHNCCCIRVLNFRARP